MLSAVVIDDESKVRETLKQMLSIYCPNINVIGEADGVESGYRIITTQNPDVVLLPFHDSRVIEFLRPRNRASALG